MSGWLMIIPIPTTQLVVNHVHREIRRHELDMKQLHCFLHQCALMAFVSKSLGCLQADNCLFFVFIFNS